MRPGPPVSGSGRSDEDESGRGYDTPYLSTSARAAALPSALEVEAMTTASRYATLTDVLRDDEAVLHRAWIAHKTVHQPRCGQDCEARQVLEDARDRIRELLAREG
jgi:hypothetical protein